MAKSADPKPLIDPAKLRAGMEAIVTGFKGPVDSPKLRAELLVWFKEQYKTAHAKAEALLFDDGDGTACAKRLATFQDVLIRLIHSFATGHLYRSENPSAGERLAIAAVGGYGRGTLAPGSDIDLLFVLPYKQTAWGEQIIEFILYFLWDMGFKVGHATRNINECLRQARADMTIRTSLLEARFIEGDATLYDEMETRFDKEIVRKTAREFIEAKLLERDGRHAKTGESRYLVEPNIKDGKGGLRDLHTLFWIGKYYYRVKRQRDLVEAGLFTADEFKRFKRAEKFLWTVRCHMHFLTGKAEERLSFDIQREMAERLKYTGHGGLQGVERFMKHYFLVAKDVGDLTLIVCAKLEEDQAKSVTGINGLIRSIRFPRRAIAGSLDFISDHGRINVADDEAFKRDPVNLLRLFKLADDNNLDFHPDAIRLVTQSLKLVDKALRANDEANRLFLDVLTSRNQPEVLLRKMNETGLLGKFIPAFGKIVAMMQFNMYHHFTVDEHLIRCVGILSGIENGRLAEDHPLATELLPDVADRTVLYLAVLIHDIAKGRKEDHSIAGLRVARQLGRRLGLSAEQTELAAWLVGEHLVMSMTAQSRDLSDRKTIENFAATVQTVERMRYLLILTICDIRAVGPGVWNGWKGQLLRTLYYETEPLLTGGFTTVDRRSRVEKAKADLLPHLEALPQAERQAYLELHYDAYFLATPAQTQIRHAEFILAADAQGEQLAINVHPLDFEEITEITVLFPDHPRLLSIIAGACAAAGANIVDAKIHTTTDGRALDSIYITREFERVEDELRRGERVGKMIREALTGKVKLDELIHSTSKTKLSAKAFSVKPRVTINNEMSNTFTVIEVKGLDRPGFLHDVTSAIAELNLNIGSAHVITNGEKVIDSFYVTDLTGDKIRSEGRQRKIIEKLTTVMNADGTRKTSPKPALVAS